MDIPTIPNNFILCFFSPFTFLLSYKVLLYYPVGLELLGWSGPLVLDLWVAELWAHIHPVLLSFKNLMTVQVKTCGFEGVFRFSPFPPGLRKIFRQKFPVTVKFDSDCFFPLSHFVSLNLIFSFLDIYSRTQLGVLSYYSFLHIKIRKN